MLCFLASAEQVKKAWLVFVLNVGDVMLPASPSDDMLVFVCRMDVSAGRDSTWRRVAAAAGGGDEDGGGGGGGGVEAQVVPLENYDSARAKIEANLRWLFAKAYGIGKAFS